MKKKIIIGILTFLVIGIIISYFIIQVNVKNNVVFSTYNKPRLLLWGQPLESNYYFSIENDDAEKYRADLVYDNERVNQTQDLLVNVNCYGITVSQTFEIVIVDEDKPIINYNHTDDVVSKNFVLDDYLEVYDQRKWDKEIFYIEKQEIYEKYNGKRGYTYYDKENPYQPYQIRKGINNVHVVAWDGHGNTSEKDISFIVE